MERQTQARHQQTNDPDFCSHSVEATAEAIPPLLVGCYDFAKDFPSRGADLIFLCQLDTCTSVQDGEALQSVIMATQLVTDLEYIQDAPRTGKITRAAATPRGIRLIAAFKLFKGLVLLAAGIGAVRLLHKDIAFELERWADMFRVDPNNHYIHLLLERLSILDARKLRELSVGTFFYSALLLTEGTGLLLGKRWAEYFTIIATSSFIPLEVYEIAKRVTAPKLVVLLLNIVVVAYLVIVLRRNHKNN
jgi:uncharacterized membrane protein (DUF2068 family)